MPTDKAIQTSHTLLQRACDTRDEQAWEEFVRHYRRFIRYILREMEVDANDLEDLTQQVLVNLTRELPSYDRSRARFRTWLSTVIRNAALNHFRSQESARSRIRAFRGTLALDDESAAPEIDRIIEKEWATYIASMAMDRVREVFQGQAVEVFKLGLEGRPAAEIAESTGLSVASVYTLRKRVKKRLYLEIRGLIAELEP